LQDVSLTRIFTVESPSNSSSEIKLASFETPAAAEPAADSVMFARDDKFLYLLAVMTKLPNEKYRASGRVIRI